MAERHPLVTPTARTIVRASMNSTKEAKNDAKTADTPCVHPMQIPNLMCHANPVDGTAMTMSTFRQHDF